MKSHLFDFNEMNEESLRKAIEKSDEFYKNNKTDSKMIQRMNSIVHLLFMSRNRQLMDYEIFLYLYLALDTCYACMKQFKTTTKNIPHEKRVQWMCEHIRIQVPNWNISKTRNDLIHEGVFFDMPLGFSIFKDNNGENTLLKMEALICRIFVWLLVGENDYVKSSITTQQKHRLDIN
jgi:hypothetical protein